MEKITWADAVSIFAFVMSILALVSMVSRRR